MRLAVVAVGMLWCCAAATQAEPSHSTEWPNWRGPGFNGVAQGTGYPLEWSNTQNVAWSVELPGSGGSTPAVWGDAVIVTAPADGKNLVLCLDRSGEALWKQQVGDERAGKHKKGSGANPSPTTDGKHIYVYFKSGDLACLDFRGEIVWQKNLQSLYGKDTLWWDLGTSPVLTASHVIVACVQSDSSYVAAFDKLTGEVVWKRDRNLNAPVESNQTYSTPILVESDGQQQLVVLGADHVTAQSVETGEEIWRLGGLNPEQQQMFRSIASPVACDDLIIAPYARGTTLTAIRLGGSGDVTDSHVAWFKQGLSADVPTPAAHDGRVYVCTDKGEVACIDGPTGDVLWRDRVGKPRPDFSASPIVVDGKLYVTREDGTTFVLELGDEFKLLATNELGEFTVATPVFTRGQILIRTAERLYCIGSPRAVASVSAD